MKLIQNEIEAEADKWSEPQNEIVKVGFIFYYLFLFSRTILNKCFFFLLFYFEKVGEVNV